MAKEVVNLLAIVGVMAWTGLIVVWFNRPRTFRRQTRREVERWLSGRGKTLTSFRPSGPIDQIKLGALNSSSAAYDVSTVDEAGRSADGWVVLTFNPLWPFRYEFREVEKPSAGAKKPSTADDWSREG